MRFLLSISIVIGILTILSACDGLFGDECSRLEESMLLIKGSEVEGIGADYYIDTFEASRSNATEEEQGTFLGRACNYVGTYPWSNVSYADAEQACFQAGKRLCTEEEWSFACASLANNVYPYGNTYQKGYCHDSGLEASHTGANPQCRSAAGLYDMSGNLREWVEGGKRMGGNYNARGDELRCNSYLTTADPYTAVPQRGDGFRCCRDVI